MLRFYSASRQAIITTHQGGTRQNWSSPKQMIAIMKSAGVRIADVHTGSYRAAIRIPTTAALIAHNADCKSGLILNVSQNGTTPMTSRKDGKKIAIVVMLYDAATVRQKAIL